MATFRLVGRTHCPNNIRRAVILEIVEQTPACLDSDAPTINTLTYPISIAVAHIAPITTPHLSGQPAVGNGGDRTHEGNGQNRDPGQGRTHHRCRKHRRADAPPPGHADGMTMDAPLWRAGNRATHSEGVEVKNSWSVPTGVVAPPPIPQGRCGMAPWLGQPGPTGARGIARNGRTHKKAKADNTSGTDPRSCTRRTGSQERDDGGCQRPTFDKRGAGGHDRLGIWFGAS
ncbi:hypothetical protein D1007_08235 [Hordeum vulgare]|nr:hypothetical protein D1007_08235 [Hordeum vulgare]